MMLKMIFLTAMRLKTLSGTDFWKVKKSGMRIGTVEATSRKVHSVGRKVLGK